MVKMQMTNKMTGKKVTPPKRGTGRLCTFRSSGTSNNRLRMDMIRILGIMRRPI